jgi:hypothetical protein
LRIDRVSAVMALGLPLEISWPLEISRVFEITWARPLGGWALLLPLLLLIASRLRTRPPTRATGTVSLWKQVAGCSDARRDRFRPRFPLPVWLAAAALLAGALALAGPRLPRAVGGVVWTVVIDHSPSVGLPWISGEGEADERGRSRLQRALEETRELLDELLEPGDRVRWISSARPSRELPAGEWPDAAWLALPPWAAPPPDWKSYREAGCLWVTDGIGEVETRDAGLIAVGGAAVEGAVGLDGGKRIDWIGGELVEHPGETGERRVLLGHGEGGARVPELLAAIFRHWASARGLTVLEPEGPAPPGVGLRLEPFVGGGGGVGGSGGGSDASRPIETGRDGWSARGLVPLELASPEGYPLERWLIEAEEEGAGGLCLVAASPGLVRVAWSTMEEVEGDPAAFAVSWAALFDAWILPPPGVVSLEERRAVGEPRTRRPEPPRRRGEMQQRAEAGDDRLDAWLCALAALLAVAAVSFGLLRGE